jgi:hypothetical protein
MINTTTFRSHINQLKLMLTFFIIFMIPVVSHAQIFGEDEVYLNGDLVDATFDGGGLEKFNAFIVKEFDFSKVTKPGKLEATFTIDKEGMLKNIRITRVLDDASAIEFMRVLSKSPAWTPAKRGGKPVSIDIKFPLVFTAKAKK